VKTTFLIIYFSLFTVINAFSCSCIFDWDDSFSKTVGNSEFIALVRIISFDEFLTNEITGLEGNIPYAMTAELVNTYKGETTTKRIKIYGDNGALCRPYLSEFKIDGYYLIAPIKLKDEEGSYTFFYCRTDYLKVNMSEYKAYGKYSLLQSEIDLKDFEKNFGKRFWNPVIIYSMIAILLFSLIVTLILRKRASMNQRS
jgi:hypothetical protein